MANAGEKSEGSDAKRHRQALWLKAYSLRLTITGACEEVGLNRETIRTWKKTDSWFKAALDDVDEEVNMVITDTYLTRAISGRKAEYDKKGNMTREELKPSDFLLHRLARARMPELFGDRAQLILPGGETLRDWLLSVGPEALTAKDNLDDQGSTRPEDLH